MRVSFTLQGVTLERMLSLKEAILQKNFLYSSGCHDTNDNINDGSKQQHNFPKDLLK